VSHWLHSLLHWLQWGTVPAWIAAVVSIWSAHKSRRSRRKSEAAELEAREQAKLATEAAQNAVAAQKQIAGETKRLADVAQQRFEDAERSPWDIKRDPGAKSLDETHETVRRANRMAGSRWDRVRSR
jgi:hypothetical protein